MIGHRRWAAAAAAVATGVGALVSGCGMADAVVGGECIAGYVRCGDTCCPVPELDAGGGAVQPTGSDGGGAKPPAHGVTPMPGRDASAGSDGAFSGNDAASGGDATGAGDAAPGSTDAGGAGVDGAVSDGDGGAIAVDGGVSGDDGGATAPPPGDDAGSSAGGSVEAGPTCVAPLVACGDQCIDVTGDPLNCGACGVVCPSGLCVASACVGSTAGGIVYIGHDFAVDPASMGTAEVLSNAVFMPHDNPLRVLAYERYAQAEAVASVDAVIDGTAQSFGRDVVVTHTSVDSDIASKLTPAAYDVLVIHDQTSAPGGAMAALGASWSATLTTFTQHYGIVVVLDGGTGVGEMPQLSTATGLLQVTAHAPAATGTPLQVVAPWDAVGVGVVTPYAATASSTFVTTEANAGNVVYVVTGMGSGASPVVVHKVF